MLMAIAAVLSATTYSLRAVRVQLVCCHGAWGSRGCSGGAGRTVLAVTQDGCDADDDEDSNSDRGPDNDNCARTGRSASV